MLAQKRLICSIHDVGPRFENEVDRLCELLLRTSGASSLALLVVPDHWRQGPISGNHHFASRLRDWNAAGCEIFLHGWCHRDEQQHDNWWAAFRGRHFTAGEGEFLGLSYAEASLRIQNGRKLLEDITGRPVAGFVAPAWLYGTGAREALRDQGLCLAEDHMQVWCPADGRVLARGPVISWASRSAWRTASSLAFASLARAALKGANVVRVAVHPGDTSKPSLLASIEHTVRHFARTHEWSGYGALLEQEAICVS